MQKVLSITLYLFLCIGISIGQEIPLIYNYTPDNYNAANQNWAVAQNDDNEIFIANNEGLLTYNGARWNLYRLPNGSVPRALYVKENRIYSGCYMQFGYWEKDDFGIYYYVPLSDNLGIKLLEDEHFWKIHRIDDWMIFQSLKRIYLIELNTNQIKIIEPSSAIIGSYVLKDQVYFQTKKEGLYQISNGEEKLLLKNALFSKNNIIAIIGHNKEILLVTATNIYTYKEEKLNTWKEPLKTYLEGKSIYSALNIHNNNIALGTISDGLIILDNDGNIKYNIRKQEGLNNNTVLTIFEDGAKNLWLGLDNGISYLNLDSPFKIYHDKNGVLGTVYASCIKDGILYLGTNQGLFYKKYPSSESFKIVPNTEGQVWFLEIFDEDVLCGHNKGTFLIKDFKAISISEVPGTWKISPLSNFENQYIQGNYNGLHVIEKVKGKWKYLKKIEGFDISSRFFEFDNPNRIVVNHEYKGIFYLTYDDSLNHIINIKKESIPEGFKSGITKYNNDILYANKFGIYKYETQEANFIFDTTLSKLYATENFNSGKLINDSKNGKLWVFQKNKLTYLTNNALDGKPIVNNILLPPSIGKSAVNYENLLCIDNEFYLLGASNGYMTINLDKLNSVPHEIKIDNISIYDDKRGFKPLLLNQESTLDYNENDIKIEYSVGEYSNQNDVLYQYSLTADENNWSTWSTSTIKNFENLEPGQYVIKVRSKIGDVLSSNMVTHSLTIKEPWYNNTYSRLLYLAILLVSYYLIHLLLKRHYKTQREKLINEKEKEIELAKLANEQRIIKLKNEKLVKDFQSKNRELGDTTFNLIEKNKILTKIKNELLQLNDGKKLVPVINFIDKNLESTDDWELFKNAFNYADNNFLNVVKERYPDLTPKDLKLCAYLRLNLSSKEIAPLLNISYKSVEIKRYRLRKKMHLAKNENLIKHLLGISPIQ